jgi:hypothetical protein
MAGKVLKCPKCGQRWTHGVAPELPFVVKETPPLAPPANNPLPWYLAVFEYSARIVWALLVLVCAAFVACCGFNFAYQTGNDAVKDTLQPPKYERPPDQREQNYIVLRRHFDAIHEGMSYDNVLLITNRHGEEVSSAGEGESKMSMYSWSNADGSSMVVGFQGGKVISKAQFGLK